MAGGEGEGERAVSVARVAPGVLAVGTSDASSVELLLSRTPGQVREFLLS